MNNITDDKMLSHLSRISGDHRPITADIFLTNFCNNNCPYCTYRRWKLDKDAREMKYSDFVKYAKRMVELGVVGIILTGGGEPTLCHDFQKIVDWLEKEQIHFGINTNFNELKYFKPDYLKVSLDGYDRESYKKRRGVDKYDVVVNNIQKYCKWRRTESPNTSVGIQWVASNCEEISMFYEANKNLDVDYFSFRPIESTGGKFYKSDIEAGKIENIIHEIKKLSEADSRVVMNFKWNLLSQREPSCTAQWAQIAVNEEGNVIYCCHKPYEIVGHILDDDILQKKEHAVTDMSKCDIPCRMTAPNKFVNQVLKVRKDSYFI